MSEELTRAQVEELIRGFASQDPEYRKALLSDPKAILGQQMGQELPANLKVKALEETADTIYLTLPYVAPGAGAELSDVDLEQVAGGFKDTGTYGGTGSEEDNTYTCNDVKGVGTRVAVIGGDISSS